MSPPRLLDPIADEYLSIGLAPTSARAYSGSLRQLERWCAEHQTTLAKVTASELVVFQSHHANGREASKLLRQALQHWWRIHPRRRPPLEAIRVPGRARGRCRALEVDEADRLEATARRSGDREGLAVLVGLYLAFRRSEIARMRWADIDDAGWIRVVGKGGIQADLPVHPVLLEALSRARHDPSGWIFPGNDGPVHPTTVWTWVRKVSAAAGVPAVATHRLRHTALATANDETRDLRAVQEFARHAKPETTALYTRVTAKRLVEVAMSISYGRSAS